MYPVCLDAADTRCASALDGWRPMTRREAWLTALGLFAIALAVRVVAASPIAFPKPEDTAYYVGVARNLVEGGAGRGLVSDALWSFGTPPLVFPRPAFEVWLPLPSLLAAIPLLLSGASAPIPLETAMRAAQVVSTVAGAIVVRADVAPRRRRRAGAVLSASAARGRSPSAPASPRPSTCRCCSTRRCPTRRCCSASSSWARSC